MSLNTSTILGGPALVTHRGATFYSRGNIKLANSKGTFNVETDRYGKVRERVIEEELKVSFEPAGEWENLAVLFPYATMLNGQLISPVSQAVTNINTATDILTITAHGFTTADEVFVHMSTGGVLPACTPTLSPGTAVFVHVIDANTFSLHDTAAHATANTNLHNFSDSGTGTFYIDRDTPLVIHTFAGIRLTLFAAAITKMPSLALSASKIPFGGVEFEAFLRNGREWNDSAARAIIENVANTDSTFDPANIYMQPYTAAWGVTAPWSSFDTETGWAVDFALDLAPVSTDRYGIRSRRFVKVDCTAKAKPVGVTESDVVTAAVLQGSGAIRGRDLLGSDLLLSGDNTTAYAKLYGAALAGDELDYSASQQRVGELTWKASRTFSAGVPNPLFAVSSTIPA